MKLTGIAKALYGEITFRPETWLLENENIDCLEQVIEKESRMLLPADCITELPKETFTQEELSEELNSAKTFVDSLLGIKAEKPKIDYFSLLDYNIESISALSYYSSGAIALLAALPSFHLSAISGLAIALAGTAFCVLGKYTHEEGKNSGYSFLNKKIIVAPEDSFAINSKIAHEYVHHLLLENKIFFKKIEEGFARAVGHEYCKYLTEKFDNPRYSIISANERCNEMHSAYLWACNKLSRKPLEFSNIANKPKINSYTLGSALFGILKEKEGKCCYKNFISAYLTSKSFFELG